VCKKSKRWFASEYFYSQIDRPYFLQNELVDPLETLDMPLEFNRQEWQLLRSCFQTISAKLTDRPEVKRRVFSQSFIDDEILQLYSYREIFRDVMKQYTKQRVTLNVTSAFVPSRNENEESTEIGG
jgi:hypothetical protein